MIDKPEQFDRSDEVNEVFEFGDRTVGLLRNQTFAFDEFGTRVASAPTLEMAVEIMPEEAPLPGALARIEQKVDAAINAILALERRINSIDSVLARLVSL